jgi:cell division protein ZipA
MTEELRWILLAAGVVLIAGVYLWGLRSRRRSVSPEHERAPRHESPPAMRASPPVAQRVEPGMEPASGSDHEGRFPSAPATLPVIELDRDDAVVARSAHTGRREPRFDAGEPAPMSAPAAPAAPRAAQPGARPAAAAQPPEGPQKILALRITAAASSPFDGRSLREAIAAAGLEFGRYKVFHRLHADGEPVFSLASLKEPGTFDPATMDGLSYRGVAMFAVLPGPLAPALALEQMLEAARVIAERLGGALQDDRGAPLSMARIEQLRAEVAALARSRPAAPGR